MKKWVGHIVDDDLGTIKIQTNIRARRIIFRVKDNILNMTLPPDITRHEIDTSIKRLKPRLLIMLQNIKGKTLIFNFEYTINTPLFHLVIERSERQMMQVIEIADNIKLLCPTTLDFQNEDSQLLVRKVITNLMVKRAEEILPKMLDNICEKCKLSYKSVRISKAQTRWGSCSSSKNISLNCYLLLLPMYLIESVMIHELCHTIEMNHGPRFWALMDQFTNNKAKALREEIKKYQCCL